MTASSLPASLKASLVEQGVALETIETVLRKTGADGDFAATLESMAGFSQTDWARLVAARLGLDFAETIDAAAIDAGLLEPVSIQYCRRNRVLPLALDGGRLLVATSDPLEPGALDDLRVLYTAEIVPVVVAAPAVLAAVNRAFDMATDTSGQIQENIEGTENLASQAAELSEAKDLLDADDEAPIIRLVNSIIFQAARDGASDIHIEPFERKTSVRFRIDGMLTEVASPPRRIHQALVSRVKVMAQMNIAEKRLPQDGGIRTRVAGRELDIRVSTVPTAFGERVVMRLLDRSSTLMGLEELGMSGRTLDVLRRLIRQSHGIVLVTGPTGSGKTTTLYAALSEINSVDKNIITIEDPVEYQLRGVGQIQVNPKIDLTFAGGLRSILRQDPDVIMVGEIRDAETAQIAIQAALTGHLVFSTLHTNDATSAVTRLLDMGIEPFLVSSSVIGILAQRLVRKLCPSCSHLVGTAEPTLAELGIRRGDAADVRAPGAGCANCRGNAFKGRTVISELVSMDDEVRAAIMQRADASSIREIASRHGMTTLREDGARKVAAGITAASEVLRVTSEDLDG